MRLSTKARGLVLSGLLGASLSSGCGAADSAMDAGPPPKTAGKIQHVIVIMQENRSFDHYFGMFPGADGFTLDSDGNPTDSNPDPALGGKQVKAFHDPGDFNQGGGHDYTAYSISTNGGSMDGFIQADEDVALAAVLADLVEEGQGIPDGRDVGQLVDGGTLPLVVQAIGDGPRGDVVLPTDLRLVEQVRDGRPGKDIRRRGPRVVEVGLAAHRVERAAARRPLRDHELVGRPAPRVRAREEVVEQGE